MGSREGFQCGSQEICSAFRARRLLWGDWTRVEEELEAGRPPLARVWLDPVDEATGAGVDATVSQGLWWGRNSLASSPLLGSPAACSLPPGSGSASRPRIPEVCRWYHLGYAGH